METPSDGQGFKTKDKPKGERPDVNPVPLNANAPGVGRATPTEQDLLKAGPLAGCAIPVNDPELYARTVLANSPKVVAIAQALADVREQNQETRLKYCPTHRTIVPAFKDDRLSCCVLADKREAADKAGWGRAIGRVCIWLEEKAQTLIDSGGDVGEAGCVSVRQHRSDARFIRQQPYEPPPSEGKQQESET